MVPSKISKLLMVACITKNAIIADNAATSLRCLAIPKAIETAKIKGKLSNNIFPVVFNKIKKLYKRVPCDNIDSACKAEMVVALVKELPKPRKIPAIGKTAMGSIKDLPIF